MFSLERFSGLFFFSSLLIFLLLSFFLSLSIYKWNFFFVFICSSFRPIVERASFIFMVCYVYFVSLLVLHLYCSCLTSVFRLSWFCLSGIDLWLCYVWFSQKLFFSLSLDIGIHKHTYACITHRLTDVLSQCDVMLCNARCILLLLKSLAFFSV